MLGASGDCLYATAVARQIKVDFPGCHLTWAVGSLSVDVLRNNPDVDAVWQVAMSDWSEMQRAWQLFEVEAHALAAAGLFDHVFLTQISPARFATYDGTVRASMLRNYPRPVRDPVAITIALDAAERAGVDAWFAASPACGASQVVLCECSSRSGQSFMSVARAQELALAVTAARAGTVVIISTHEALDVVHPRIVSAGALSIRQTARLTDHVDLFVGCGSALTVAATSPAARPGLPIMQVLRAHTSVYASFRHDFAYHGRPVDQFLELTSEDPAHLARATIAALSDGFPAAQAAYDAPVALTFDWYIELITLMLVDTGRYCEAAQSLLLTAGRYGWHPQLAAFARHCVLPFLDADPRAGLPHRREEADRLRAGLA